MTKNIILLFGGASDERLVSTASAQAMSLAINPSYIWFWDESGLIYDVSLAALQQHQEPFTISFKPQNKPIFNDIASAIASSLSKDHVFLLALHGGDGENGYIQNILEKHHRPYTGSNAQASALAFNKIATKQALANSVLLSPHLCFKQNEDIAKPLAHFLEQHRELIIKPICGGSSLGCMIIKNNHDMIKALSCIHNAPHHFMVEKLIKGRELTVGVIESDQGLIALTPIEIILDHDCSFDYQGKYLGKGSKEILLTDPVDAALGKAAQEIALKAHQCLGLSGYSRSDFIAAIDGIYYLESNTLPGLTLSSLLPQQLKASHINFDDFLRVQIDLAIKRWR